MLAPYRYMDDMDLLEMELEMKNLKISSYHQIIEIGCEVDDKQPVLGRPRYKKYQPVKFEWNTRDETMHLVGIVAIVDAYGTYETAEEPSYDIYSWLKDERGLFKHIWESKVWPLSDEEARENSKLLTVLATHWGK